MQFAAFLPVALFALLASALPQIQTPESISERAIEITSGWDRIKDLPGTTYYCTDRDFQGPCGYRPAQHVGKCSLLVGTFSAGVSSIAVSKGGQCCFWEDYFCNGAKQLYKATTEELIFNLEKPWDDRFKSYACWNHTETIPGTV